jgi:hypothetical protein
MDPGGGCGIPAFIVEHMQDTTYVLTAAYVMVYHIEDKSVCKFRIYLWLYLYSRMANALEAQ